LKHVPLLGAAAIALSLVGPAVAQDLARYEAAEAQAIAAWLEMPLTVRNAAFITGEAGGYGLNVPRPNAAFAPGEPIVMYAEPLGYGWRENDDGSFTFGLSIDLILRNGAGEVVAQRTEFQRAALTSQQRNREFFITLTLDLTNAPAGDYIAEYVVNDIVEDQSATISLPFTLTGE
jgi:hypothetical protein